MDAPTPVGAAGRARWTRAHFATPFRWFAWCMGGGIGLFAAGLGAIVVGAFTQMGSRGQPTTGFLAIAMVGALLYLVGFAAMITGVVFHMILLFRAWDLVQDGHARTTPGKAVGFLFIPFYNFYWIFVANHGLAKDLNAFARRHGSEARPVGEGLGLTCAVLMLLTAIPYLGMLAAIPAFVVLVIYLRQVVATAGDIAESTAAPDVVRQPA